MPGKEVACYFRPRRKRITPFNNIERVTSDVIEENSCDSTKSYASFNPLRKNSLRNISTATLCDCSKVHSHFYPPGKKMHDT